MKTAIFTALFLSSTLLSFGQKFQNVIFTTNDDSAKVYIDDYLIGSGKHMIASLKKDGDEKLVEIISTRSKREVFTIEPSKSKEYKDSFHFELTSRKFRAKDEKYVSVNNVEFAITNEDTGIFFMSATTRDYSDANFDNIERREKDRYIKRESKVVNGTGTGQKLKLDEESVKNKYDGLNFNRSSYLNLKQLGYVVDTQNLFLYNYENTLFVDVKITEFVVAYYYNYSYNGNSETLKKRVKFRSTIYIKNVYNEIIDSINGTSISEVSTAHMLKVLDKKMGEVVEDFLSGDFIKKYIKIQKESLSNDASIVIKRSQNSVKNLNEAIKSSVIVEKDSKRFGSGFAINDDGYILTNYHVVSKQYINSKSSVFVVLPNKERLPAEIIRTDKIHDLALLKVNKKFEYFFQLSDVKKFQLFDQVYAIGTPQSKELDNSVSIGVLSNERVNDGISMLQLNMSINSGNSGGPLIDKEGNLHGIIVAKLFGAYTEGIGFAIPAYMCPSFLKLKFE